MEKICKRVVSKKKKKLLCKVSSNKQFNVSRCEADLLDRSINLFFSWQSRYRPTAVFNWSADRLAYAVTRVNQWGLRSFWWCQLFQWEKIDTSYHPSSNNFLCSFSYVNFEEDIIQIMRLHFKILLLIESSNMYPILIARKIIYNKKIS